MAPLEPVRGVDALSAVRGWVLTTYLRSRLVCRCQATGTETSGRRPFNVYSRLSDCFDEFDVLLEATMSLCEICTDNVVAIV
jgi:hypothetical protein